MEDMKEFSLGIGNKVMQFSHKQSEDAYSDEISQKDIVGLNPKFAGSTASFESIYAKNLIDSDGGSEPELNTYDQNEDVILNQSDQIKDYEEQIMSFKEKIDHLEIKVKQADLYKEQNSNYRKQIQAFEQKIMVEENDKKYKSE
jgi:hypothetical protein